MRMKGRTRKVRDVSELEEHIVMVAKERGKVHEGSLRFAVSHAEQG